MYGKDKTEAITIRLTVKQIEFISTLANKLGISKSDVIRGYINKEIGGKNLYEYKQTNIHSEF